MLINNTILVLNFLTCLILMLSSKVSSESDISKQQGFVLQQNDYKMKFEHTDVINVSKDYMQEFRIHTFKYNRSCTAFNVTLQFKLNMENNFYFVMETYKFVSNEYRGFPMRFQVDVCDAISKNYFGFGSIGNYGNYTGCPIRKGVKYIIRNFAPDQTRFPPLIPNGRYMVEVQMLYKSRELGIFRVYSEVYRPFSGKYE